MLSYSGHVYHVHSPEQLQLYNFIIRGWPFDIPDGKEGVL